MKALPVAILAGGLGSRLQPLTSEVPKVLLEVAGRPFVLHQLELLNRQGIRRVVLCVGHLGEQIMDSVGDGADLGMQVEYSFDGETLLGTGGALKRALPLLGPSFFVLYGDSYLPCAFADVQLAFEESGKSGLMTVLRNNNLWDRSNVLLRNGRIVEYNKTEPRSTMEHIDYGLGVLTAASMDRFQGACRFDLGDVYRDLSLRGELAAFETRERFYEVGSPSGLLETERFLMAARGTR